METQKWNGFGGFSASSVPGTGYDLLDFDQVKFGNLVHAQKRLGLNTQLTILASNIPGNTWDNDNFCLINII